MRLTGLPGDDRSKGPASDDGAGHRVLIEEVSSTAEWQVIGAAGVHHMPHIERAGKVVQAKVAQRVKAGGTVTATTVIAGGNASLHAGSQGLGEGVVHIKLRSMGRVLAEVHLQRVVVR